MPARAMLTSWPCPLPGSMSWSVIVHVATKGHITPKIWVTTSDKVIVKDCATAKDTQTRVTYAINQGHGLVLAKLQPGQCWICNSATARVYDDTQGAGCHWVQISKIWATTWGHVGIHGSQSHWVHVDLSDLLCQSGPWWYPGPGFGQGQCLGPWSNHSEGLCWYPCSVVLPRAMEQLGSVLPPRAMLASESSVNAGAIHIWAACAGTIGHAVNGGCLFIFWLPKPK